ncbi:MAG: hypothetical protein ACPGO3_00180 [Magnetospiraceae bacterium]
MSDARKNFRFSPEMARILEALAEEDHVTEAEIVRRALNVFKWVHEEQKKYRRVIASLEETISQASPEQTEEHIHARLADVY